MIVLIDNYDSFVHNLARYFEELGARTMVIRNREVTAREIDGLSPEAVVISPGPCDPDRAGVSVPAVRELSGRIPILGICLGHQAIAAALGGTVVRAPEPIHGMASAIHHDGEGIFRGLPSPFAGGRYHSLAVRESDLPPFLRVTAATADGKGGRVVMAVRHRSAPTVGLQFHPESVLTEHGHRLLWNFLELAREFRGERQGAAKKQAFAGPAPLRRFGVAGEGDSALVSSAAGAARAGLPRGGPPVFCPPIPPEGAMFSLPVPPEGAPGVAGPSPGA